MRVLVIVHPVPKDIRKFFDLKPDDYIIGVDQAILALYKQRIPVHLAVGDFDSLKNQGILTQLDTVRLEPEKDDTDTHRAMVEAMKKNPEELVMIGGFGGLRIEHFIAHLTLFNEFNKLVMIDENSKIYLLTQGKYETQFKGYISLFSYPDSVITLEGFKYPLTHYELKLFDPLCISNEIVDIMGHINIEKGQVIVVESQKD